MSKQLSLCLFIRLWDTNLIKRIGEKFIYEQFNTGQEEITMRSANFLEESDRVSFRLMNFIMSEK